MAEREFPTDGKVVFAAPDVAVRLVEAAPSYGMRVFASTFVPDDCVYVLDIDALYDALPFPVPADTEGAA